MFGHTPSKETVHRLLEVDVGFVVIAFGWFCYPSGLVYAYLRYSYPSGINSTFSGDRIGSRRTGRVMEYDFICMREGDVRGIFLAACGSERNGFIQYRFHEGSDTKPFRCTACFLHRMHLKRKARASKATNCTPCLATARGTT